MKALSIRQPWAWFIAKGIKDVENRSWWTATRGRIYIHAGKKLDEDGLKKLLTAMADAGIKGEPAKDDLTLGAIIGEADIIDCKFRKPLKLGFSLWHEVGCWGFILANATLYDKPIPCRGQLGFFEVDIDQITGEAETEYSPEFRRD